MSNRMEPKDSDYIEIIRQRDETIKELNDQIKKLECKVTWCNNRLKRLGLICKTYRDS